MTIYIHQEPKFCTYLTTYSGNKLPMFYIGSTSIDKILNKNYHGTVCSKKYKDIWNLELKQNPHLFKTKILRSFHSRKNATYHERKLQKSMNVIKSSMYINMAIAAPNGFFGMPNKDKIFSDVTRKKLSVAQLGKTMSPESKLKMSAAKIGKTLNYDVWMKGKSHSAETKMKMSIARLGKILPQRTVTCPHCGKEGGQAVMARWHFDNCKFNQPQEISSVICPLSYLESTEKGVEEQMDNHQNPICYFP